MDQNLKQKSIASWANYYENNGFKVWSKTSLLHKPPEINGYMPDVLAMRRGQSIAVVIRDDEELSKDQNKLLYMREWTYHPQKVLILAEPGMWPNVVYMVVS